MKIIISVLLLILSLCLSAPAQTVVSKLPGEPTTFFWEWAIEDEPNATGFRLYSSTVEAGPFTFTGVAATPSSLREIVIPASFPLGKIKVYYMVRAFFESSGGTIESSDSTSVEVDRVVPSLKVPLRVK